MSRHREGENEVQAYADEAVSVKDQGFKAYKVHPRGQDLTEDIAIHRGVRTAVGPDFTLMSDPVGCFNLEDAIRFGRELERMDYLWLEEPLFDENVHSLRELTRVLDLYDRIKIETARKVVEHWRLDPDYLFALKQVNSGQQQAVG